MRGGVRVPRRVKIRRGGVERVMKYTERGLRMS